MDFLKTLKSVEELIYEFAVSLVLIPRTLLKILRSPTWAVEYVSSENKEKPKARFEKYSNPVFFWLVMVVLSCYFLLEFVICGYAEGKVLVVYNNISIFSKIGGLALLFTCLPVGCAFILQIFKYKGFTKTTFRRSFFIQCYCTAPLQLLFIPAILVDELPDLLALIVMLATFVVVAWFLIAEVLITRKELQCGWLKGLFALVLMYFSYFFFAFVTTTLFFLSNMSNLRALVDACLE